MSDSTDFSLSDMSNLDSSEQNGGNNELTTIICVLVICCVCSCCITCSSCVMSHI
jgi:hypothetical protein